MRTDTRFTAELQWWLRLLRTDAERGTAHFAEMLPLMAFGPRYWAATAPAANAALVAELAEFVPPGAARQAELDAGHGAPAEDPDEFVRAIVAFLDRVPAHP